MPLAARRRLQHGLVLLSPSVGATADGAGGRDPSGRSGMRLDAATARPRSRAARAPGRRARSRSPPAACRRTWPVAGVCAMVMPPARLDLADARRAVRRRARQDDADRAVLGDLGERAEEVVDRRVLRAVRRARQRGWSMPSSRMTHLDVRRDHVDVVAARLHALGGLDDRQRRLLESRSAARSRAAARDAARRRWRSPGCSAGHRGAARTLRGRRPRRRRRRRPCASPARPR